MSEQTTPEAPQEAPADETPRDGIAALIAHQEAAEAAKADRQAEAVAAAEAGIDETLKATADAERAAYLKATEPTRKAKGYVERHQAYDRVRLAFIEGTAAEDAVGAKRLAKALPAYADRPAADIETRPI